ncbi:MAG TPA: nicotinate phosphoribosyltransferase [Deltaproteobacteria bacterium]|nr:nicotinate phosphoribosyltransferase [Deltaproteobacteria bacterium]HPR53677.1 nicotinate phosphoribosyltransferase [Deltaproteobacteria bacterium]HXK47193.1 nicotinate phosphoribosyltransferase [Deltaproteobacteria bacterium]
MRRLHIADTEQVRAGDVTDVYFLRTEEVLRAKHASRRVCMEVFLKSWPDARYSWGVFAGLEEACVLLEGREVTIRAMPEGSVFFTNEPVMTIEGDYLAFGELETAVLGCLCQASGIATKASRCRIACGNKGLISFGARRMHPSIAPMVERAAFIGGCDGVAAVASARLIGERPVGTMPHALILQMGDTVSAALAFDEVVDAQVPRIVLIDTFADEKFEALRVAEALGTRLKGIRLDTPSSRRGNFRALMEEVRWELDLRGFNDVKLYASGGLNLDDILDLNDVVDSFGVGTQISSAATLDFSMDVVAIDGKPLSKRGKNSGMKDVLRCRECMKDYVVPSGTHRQCACSGITEPVLRTVMAGGVLTVEPPSARQVRGLAMEQLERLRSGRPPRAFLNL